ncbi:hypothetical protein VTI74DRAFT_6363 [Chaetomium olivicolor]
MLFWYFRWRKHRQSLGSPPATSLALFPERKHALPDFTKRFGKRFSADDFFGAEDGMRFESRTVLLSRPRSSPACAALPRQSCPNPASHPEGWRNTGRLWYSLRNAAAGDAFQGRFPTTMSKQTDAPAKPTTSLAVTWNVKSWGGWTRNSEGGVGPTKASLLGSKDI